MANRAINALVSSGADAFANTFDVKIKFPWSDSFTTMVRAQGFEVKDATTASYKIDYHGNSLDRPGTKMEFDRGFSLTFRMDAAYSLYGAMVEWHEAVTDPVNGGVSNYPSALGEVKVVALSGVFTAAEMATTLVNEGGDIKESSTSPIFSYSNVWVTHVSQPSYDHSSGDSAMTFTVDFKFADTSMPFYNGQGITGGKA